MPALCWARTRASWSSACCAWMRSWSGSSETTALLPEQLAVYQIHSATEASAVLENDPVLGRLERLRDAGAVAIGASASHPQLPVLERAAGIDRGGRPLFGSLQATFNLLDQSAAPALAAAAGRGAVVIVKEALANGRLTARADAASPAARALAAEAEPAPATRTPVDWKAGETECFGL